MFDYLHETLKVITNHHQIIHKLKSIVSSEISKIRSNSTYDLSSDCSTMSNVLNIKNSRNSQKKLVNNKSNEHEKTENNIKQVPLNAIIINSQLDKLKISLCKKDKSPSPGGSIVTRKRVSMYKVDRTIKESFDKNVELKNELQNRENSNGKLSVNKIRLAFRNAFKSLKGNILQKESKKTVGKFKEDTVTMEGGKTILAQYKELNVNTNLTGLYDDKKELNFSGDENQEELFKRLQSNLGENFTNFFNFSYDKYHEVEGNKTKTIESITERNSILEDNDG
jgi:hypothetical protein